MHYKHLYASCCGGGVSGIDGEKPPESVCRGVAGEMGGSANVHPLFPVTNHDSPLA